MTTKTARISKCACGTSMASSSSPMFFESRDKDSWYANNICSVCPMYKVAHEHPDGPDHEFTPVGASEFDSFYCGCRGLD